MGNHTLTESLGTSIARRVLLLAVPLVATVSCSSTDARTTATPAPLRDLQPAGSTRIVRQADDGARWKLSMYRSRDKKQCLALSADGRESVECATSLWSGSPFRLMSSPQAECGPYFIYGAVPAQTAAVNIRSAAGAVISAEAVAQEVDHVTIRTVVAAARGEMSSASAVDSHGAVLGEFAFERGKSEPSCG